MLKETSLCMGCMNDKTYDGPCKLCGYSDDMPCIPTYLAPKTFLAERYIVGKLLSYNGEGAVYIAFDTATSSKVTIKEYMPDTLCTRRKGETDITVYQDKLPLYKTYMSEFADLNRSLMKSRGMAHIQTVLDVFFENNTCYTVFEFINGITLKSYLASSEGAMTWDRVKELFPPILTTLSLVHAGGIIHRGISPQTIFVDDKGELRLAGFAISAARTTNTEIACEVYSGFAAPEQYTNEINGTWTDVYGIAAVLYRCLTGVNPQEAIARTAGSLPEPMMINRSVPSNVSKVIMMGMRPSPETRIRDITQFVDMLFAQPTNDRAAERPVSAREEKLLRKRKKERIKFIASMVLLGIVLITFAVVLTMAINGSLSPKPNSSLPDSSEPAQTTAYTPADTSVPEPESSQPADTTTSENLNISMPDFENRQYDATVTRYEGIFTFIPTYEYSEEYDAGAMYDQSIEAGTMVAEGTQIEVKVSKGKSIVPLPDYSGMLISDYLNELNKLNIKYAVDTLRTNEVPSGEVARCSKEIGDLVNVRDGEVITVLVASNYEEDHTLPETEPAETTESTEPTETSDPEDSGIPVEGAPEEE